MSPKHMLWEIPAPHFERVPFDLHGLNLFQRLLFLLLNPPRLRLVRDWMIITPEGTRLFFPKGFISDGASVPRLLWFIPGFSPFGPLLEGSIVHDFAYQYGYLLRIETELPTYKPLTRPHYQGKPQLFFDSMMADIVSCTTGAKWVPEIAYLVLARFGRRVWRKYRVHGPGYYNTNSLCLPGSHEGWKRNHNDNVWP
jgi:hypothetical protein